MKFKHTVLVAIDNFGTCFKLLVYLLVVMLISCLLYAAVIIPFVNNLPNIETYNALTESISNLVNSVSEGEISELIELIRDISDKFSAFINYVLTNASIFTAYIIGMIICSLVRRFLIGLGNYSAASLINDRMAMQANSPFVATLTKNLGKACLYNLIYVPLSFAYDIICTITLYLVLFVLLSFTPLLIKCFLFVVFVIMLLGVKMMFTTDWLPAMIAGKQKVGAAMEYALSRESKTSLSVFSTFAVSCIIIMSINVLGAISTFGAGVIITVPLSYLYIICYEFVNYCDNNKIKYFVDKRTIIKPETEEQTSREQFLKGK